MDTMTRATCENLLLAQDTLDGGFVLPLST